MLRRHFKLNAKVDVKLTSMLHLRQVNATLIYNIRVRVTQHMDRYTR